MPDPGAVKQSQEMMQDMHDLNALYQDIENILNSDQITQHGKLVMICDRNKEIGKITAKWV